MEDNFGHNANGKSNGQCNGECNNNFRLELTTYIIQNFSAMGEVVRKSYATFIDNMNEFKDKLPDSRYNGFLPHILIDMFISYCVSIYIDRFEMCGEEFQQSIRKIIAKTIEEDGSIFANLLQFSFDNVDSLKNVMNCLNSTQEGSQAS